MSDNLLTFVHGGNAKLQGNVHTFSLPAGHSCPGAKDCLSRADPDTGKISDGKFNKFRCFAATSEAMYSNVRESRWNNFNLLMAAGTVSAMTELLLASMPKKLTHMRIHVSGDFFSQTYFDAWCRAASARPEVEFYAYTKSLRYWVSRIPEIPKNLRLVASYGGKHDELIAAHDLPNVVVVSHPEEATALGLEVDHDDSLAADHNVQRFALLIHGQQAPSSKGSAAIKRMKAEGVQFSYPA